MSFLLSGTDDGSVRFWQLDTGAGESFQAHDNTVSALAAYRDQLGSLVLASAGFEGVIIIWRAHAKDGLKKDRVRKRRSQSYRFDGICSHVSRAPVSRAPV